jgi:hypothetical protein
VANVLTDRSRRPVRYANQLPQQIETLIAGLTAALRRAGKIGVAHREIHIGFGVFVFQITP